MILLKIFETKEDQQKLLKLIKIIENIWNQRRSLKIFEAKEDH